MYKFQNRLILFYPVYNVIVQKNSKSINWNYIVYDFIVLLIFLFYEFLTLDYISSLRLYCTTTVGVNLKKLFRLTTKSSE